MIWTLLQCDLSSQVHWPWKLDVTLYLKAFNLLVLWFRTTCIAADRLLSKLCKDPSEFADFIHNLTYYNFHFCVVCLVCSVCRMSRARLNSVCREKHLPSSNWSSDHNGNVWMFCPGWIRQFPVNPSTRVLFNFSNALNRQNAWFFAYEALEWWWYGKELEHVCQWNGIFCNDFRFVHSLYHHRLHRILVTSDQASRLRIH